MHLGIQGVTTPHLANLLSLTSQICLLPNGHHRLESQCVLSWHFFSLSSILYFMSLTSPTPTISLNPLLLALPLSLSLPTSLSPSLPPLLSLSFSLSHSPTLSLALSFLPPFLLLLLLLLLPLLLLARYHSASCTCGSSPVPPRHQTRARLVSCGPSCKHAAGAGASTPWVRVGRGKEGGRDQGGDQLCESD